MTRHHKNKIDYTLRYFYKEYLKSIKTKYKKSAIPETLYSKILTTFFTLAIHKIINEAYRLVLPKLGLIYLTKEKQKITKNKKTGKIHLQSSVNWVETKKTGKKVYYMNDHTNKHIYRIRWDKNSTNFINSTFYNFKIYRRFNQNLFHAIMNSYKPLNAFKPWYQ